MEETIYVRLTWNDPQTGAVTQHTYSPPIALGREYEQMPSHVGGKAVNRVVLPDPQVSRYHALITSSGGQVILTDRSANGTELNGERLHQTSRVLQSQDVLRLGSHRITVTLTTTSDPDATHIHAPTTAAPVTVVPKRSVQYSGLMILLALALVIVAAAAALTLVTTLLERFRPKPTSMSYLFIHLAR
ncbi:MAG: FHA domain-containing protein [Gloeomargarita sp. SKYBB_i_bin120]|nr:FHA domain-containing protein [Gloeomargarita sp. SKYG98]MCS7292330.1 FHA domain-containing protein [Gloeomargarita sp. SKYB120]MDW8177890.1 FHA domain-containing protein [Gloeomargarita sp. SKYBB_i_bin120]